MLPKQRQKNTKKAQRNRNAYVSAIHVDLIAMQTNREELLLLLLLLKPVGDTIHDTHTHKRKRSADDSSHDALLPTMNEFMTQYYRFNLINY